MTRYSKETFVCDRPNCGAVHERIQGEGTRHLPPGWSEHEQKHYCPKHRIVVSIVEVVGERGQWTEEK